MVLSRNEDQNADDETHYSRVTQLFVRQTDLLYNISFADGSRLETTWNHPFWIEGSGWVETKDLKSGDLTVLSSGERLEIQSVEETPQEKEVTVYNFEVENDHTYFVADKDTTSDETSFVWVHNQAAIYVEGAEAALKILGPQAVAACAASSTCNDLVNNATEAAEDYADEQKSFLQNVVTIGGVILDMAGNYAAQTWDYVFGAEDGATDQDINPADLSDRPKDIAGKTGLTEKEVRDKIHDIKKNLPKPKSGERRNPDVEVDTKTGEVYPKLGNGKLGDSIGNIYD